MLHKVLAIIPARGNSKGIPRKNIRLLAGKPLIVYSINNALQSKYITDVIVTTDNDEVAHISELAGVYVIKRPGHLADDYIPLDPVIYHATKKYETIKNKKYDFVITIQPTSPLISSNTIDEVIKRILDKNIDTIITAIDDRHLTWTKINDKFIPNYNERQNRQLLPPNYIETGGAIISKRKFIREKSRFGNNIELFEINAEEGVDIDTKMDWWVAEKILLRKKILIRVDGFKEIGLGHIYRTLSLANNLIDHEILFVLNIKSTLGKEIINESNYEFKIVNNNKELLKIIENYKPDIVINDILDTNKEYVQTLKKYDCFVCNFEDLGNGAKHADIVFNALYKERYPLENHFWGSNYFCLREEFYLSKSKVVNKNVNEILLTFGGVDANNYTERVLKVIIKNNSVFKLNKITVIVGLGYDKINSLEKYKNDKFKIDIKHNVKHISKYIYRADLILTSAGRTVYEIASIGTPTIVLAQNNREMNHTFASSENGFINMGLGNNISDEELIESLGELIDNFSIREKCNKLMLRNNLKNGVKNILSKLFEIYEKKGNSDGYL